MKKMLIMFLALLLVTACMPKEEIATEDDTEDLGAMLDATDAPDDESKVMEKPEPVVTPPKLTSPSKEMSADTEARLKTAFGEGNKFAISHNSYEMSVGDRMVFGVGLRSLAPGEETYQIKFDLNRAYDKSNNKLDVELKDVWNWISDNGIDKGINALPPYILKNTETRTFPFVVEVTPTYTDGRETMKGSYEFELVTYRKYNFESIMESNDKYAEAYVVIRVV